MILGWVVIPGAGRESSGRNVSTKGALWEVSTFLDRFLRSMNIWCGIIIINIYIYIYMYVESNKRKRMDSIKYTKQKMFYLSSSSSFLRFSAGIQNFVHVIKIMITHGIHFAAVHTLHLPTREKEKKKRRKRRKKEKRE